MLFGKYIIKMKLMDRIFAEYFEEAFDLRQIGDYEVLEEMSEERVRDVIAKAEKFIATIKGLI